jgi:hypothetical protein
MPISARRPRNNRLDRAHEVRIIFFLRRQYAYFHIGRYAQHDDVIVCGGRHAGIQQHPEPLPTRSVLESNNERSTHHAHPERPSPQ